MKVHSFVHGRDVCIGLMAGFLALFATGCLPPAVKEVKRPRDGRPQNRRICLVYSYQYQVSLAGLEKLHPFDIRKYEKIYLQLTRSGLVHPDDVYVPESIDREGLLRIHTDRLYR